MRQTGSDHDPALPDIDLSIAMAQSMRNEEKHRAIVSQKREIDIPSIAICAMGARKPMGGVRNWAFMPLLILLVWLLGATSALSQVVACRPLLSTKAVREVRPFPQPLPWRWHATIISDAGFCATRSGNFEMDFVRIKEYSPDLQFTQAFRWTQNQFDISMELSPDEAILEFRIGFIAPCVCREAGQLSSDPRVK